MKSSARWTEADLATIKRHLDGDTRPVITPAAPEPNEHAHARWFVEWFKRQYPCQWTRCYHIPNERADAIQAAILQGEGCKAGVSDYCLALPMGAYHGLYVELKATFGRESSPQIAWQKQCLGDGYFAAFAYGWSAAAAVVTAYLRLDPGALLPDALQRVKK